MEIALDLAWIIMGLAGIAAFALLATLVRASVVDSRQEREREQVDLIRRLREIGERRERLGSRER